MKPKSTSRDQFSISGLMSKARSGRLGDLRLLALAAIIVLFCVVALIVQIKRHSTGDSTLSTSVTAKGSDAGEHTSTQGGQEQAIEEASSPPISETGSPEKEDAGTPSREEQQRKSKEMAEQIPPGEVIVY